MKSTRDTLEDMAMVTVALLIHGAFIFTSAGVIWALAHGTDVTWLQSFLNSLLTSTLLFAFVLAASVLDRSKKALAPRFKAEFRK